MKKREGMRSQGAAGEVLYNGIRLPPAWPPQNISLTPDPPPPAPYLISPPEVIPIDVGRQLFVDGYLVEATTLKRTFHRPDYHPASPVLEPDQPWEQGDRIRGAIPFSDGVWHDPEDRLFKMWYSAKWSATCYAVSEDGIRWTKPALDVQGGTNIVHPVARDSGTVWLDLDEKDPGRRFKLFIVTQPNTDIWVLSVCCSPDGIHWTDTLARSSPCGDRTTAFFNLFRGVWVYSIRSYLRGVGRCRSYREDPDAIAGTQWKPDEPTLWVGADRLDGKLDPGFQPELYTLDAAAYESVLLGLFSIMRGQRPDGSKINDVVVGFSRDGFHWDRPDRSAFLPVSERPGDWNWGYLHAAGGGCLVVGDRLHFYVCGRAPLPGGRPGLDGDRVYRTGLATLRRDGFASMDAGDAPGTLTTRPVRFRGKHLFVNVDAGSGELRAEVLDEAGKVIAPFSRAECEPVRANKTLQPVRWKGAGDLSALAERPVKFRFHLTNGRLYAFWVSPEASGASHGYVAAGGPGFSGHADTIGEAAYGR